MSRREPAARCSLAPQTVRLATSDIRPLQGSPALVTSVGPSARPCAPDVAGRLTSDDDPGCRRKPRAVTPIVHAATSMGIPGTSRAQTRTCE